MRPIESFEKLHRRDFIIIGAIAVVLVLLLLIFSQYLLVSLGITSVFLVFISLLIRKMGVQILLCILVGFFLQFTSAFEGLHTHILVIFIAMGCVYEFINFFSYHLLKFTYASVILASGLALSSVSWVLYLIVNDRSSVLLYHTLNMSLHGFIIGIFGALVGLALWQSIKYKKRVIEYEYE